MKKKIPLFIFIIGGLILSYPFYSQAFNRLYDSYTVSTYLKSNQREFETMREALQTKNEILTFNAGDDPFSDSASGVWEESLFKKHMIGTVVIPKIHLEVVLFDTTTPDLLERGATVLNGTSQPLGTTDSHAVITAHRGLPNRELFTNITKLEIGDTFIVSSYGQDLAYKIDSIDEVEPHETDRLKLEKGEDRVTLITCTPYMINTHRLLVSAHRDDTLENVQSKIETTKKSQLGKNIIILGSIGLSTLFGVYLLTRKTKQE